MPAEDWLFIDPKSCTPAQLVEYIAQLEDGQHDGLRIQLQQELIDRLKKKGCTNARIIELLVQGVSSPTMRDKIGKGWASAFGLTETEFKRIVRGN